MTYLVSLLVTSRNLLFGIFLPRKIIKILQKKNMSFRRVTKGVLLSVSVLEYLDKIYKKFYKSINLVESLKKTLLHMHFFTSGFYRFPVRFFPPIYRRSLFVSYMVNIFCIRIHICKKYSFPIFLLLRWKRKAKKKFCRLI